MVSANNTNPSPLSMKFFPLPLPPPVNPSIEQSAADIVGASFPPASPSNVITLLGDKFVRKVFSPLKISPQLKLLKNP